MKNLNLLLFYYWSFSALELIVAVYNFKVGNIVLGIFFIILSLIFLRKIMKIENLKEILKDEEIQKELNKNEEE